MTTGRFRVKLPPLIHLMNKKQEQAVELEAELIRLNNLVRARRKQLANLEKCPNKTCECRVVWREVVEKNLASQMGRIRRQVRSKALKS